MPFLKTYIPVAIIAIWMLAGGIAHFLVPEAFFAIVPDILPKYFVVYASGVPELLIGAGILHPKTRALAGLGFAILCVCFLPLHLWDLVRDDPAITPHTAAIIRVFVQFFLIWLGLHVWKRRRLKKA